MKISPTGAPLLWGGAFLSVGLGMLVYGQIGMLRGKGCSCRGQEHVTESSLAVLPFGSVPPLGAPGSMQTARSGRKRAPNHTSPGRAGAKAPDRMRTASRVGAVLQRSSYRSVMPLRKVRLSSGLKNWLRRRAKRGLPPGWLYVITGYATERSSRSKNVRLARARAEAVRRYLVARLGVSPDRIRIHLSVKGRKKGHRALRRGVRVCVGRGKECR